MKKILEKIVTITLAFIGLLFVVLMLVLMFKPEYAENLNNQLVHVLIIIFSGMFAILTALNISTAFSDADKINSVLLFKSRASATKATIGVVKRTAKNAIRRIEGARMKKVTLFVDENNDVRLKVDIKVVSEDVESLVRLLRAVVINTFEEVLGLVFSSVDFKLVKVKNTFKPDSDKIDKAVAEFKAEQEAEKAEKARRLAEENEKAAKEEKIEAEKDLMDDSAQQTLAADEAAQTAEIIAGEATEEVEEADELPEIAEVIEEETVSADEAQEESKEAEFQKEAEKTAEEMKYGDVEDKPFSLENIEQIVSDIPADVLDKQIDAQGDE